MERGLRRFKWLETALSERTDSVRENDGNTSKQQRKKKHSISKKIFAVRLGK
jgi:hypothetical protein